MMKKTLFTILAYCLSVGMAQALMEDTDYDITLKFEDLTPQVEAGFMPNRLLGTPQAGTLTPVQQKGNTGSTYISSFLSPDANVGSTSGATWTYTCRFVAGADFTLKGLSLAMVTFNNNGQTQYSDRTSNLEISLTQTTVNDERNEIGTYDGAVRYIGAGESVDNKAPTYNFTDKTISNGSGAIVTLSGLEPVFINVGDTVTLTVTAKNGSTVNSDNGHFVGLGAAQFNVTVPEPSTATLSLLVLAGLCARRRRK